MVFNTNTICLLVVSYQMSFIRSYSVIVWRIMHTGGARQSVDGLGMALPENNMKSSIPATLSTYSPLCYLRITSINFNNLILDMNQFTGIFPSELGQLEVMKALYILIVMDNTINTRLLKWSDGNYACWSLCSYNPIEYVKIWIFLRHLTGREDFITISVIFFWWTSVENWP